MEEQNQQEEKKTFKRQNPIFLGVILLCAGIAVALTQYKIPTIMMAIMGLFDMDAATASWLMSIFTLMGIIFAIPSGALAQKFGAKNMMMVALIIAVCGSMIGLFAGTSPVLIFSRAIEGVALTILTTCGPIVVQKCVVPEKIGSTMGVWGIWGCLGSTIAALITPTLFETAGFSGVWIFYAVVCVIMVVVLFFAVRMPPKDFFPAVEAAVAEAQSEDAPTGLAAYKAIFSKDVVLFFIGFAIFNICLLAILSFVPTILQMQDFDQTLSGFISTAPMLLSIVASPLFGTISDKIGKVKPLLCLAMFVMGPCTMIMYNNTGVLLWVAVLVMGLIGMGAVGLFLSGFTKLLPRPELVAVGMGVMVCIQGLGQFLGSFMVQALLGDTLTNWFFAGIVLMILGFIGTAAIALTKMK